MAHLVCFAIHFLLDCFIPPLEYVLTVTMGNGGGYASQTPSMSRHPKPSACCTSHTNVTIHIIPPQSRAPPQYSQQYNQQYQSQRQPQYDQQYNVQYNPHDTPRQNTDRTRTDTSRILTIGTSTARTTTDSTETDVVTTVRTEELETILTAQMTGRKQRTARTTKLGRKTNKTSGVQ